MSGKEPPPDEGGQAFPRAGFDGPDDYEPSEDGATLRDYFSAAALTGLLSHPQAILLPAKELAANAYRYADAMIQARKP